MSFPVLAISLPYSDAGLFFAILENLGLTAEPMSTHELFTNATDFYETAVADSDLDTGAASYQVLAGLKPNHFLPGYFFYSKAGAGYLKQLGIKKIVLVRDPRDLTVGQVVEAAAPSHPFYAYYQKLPDNFSRISAFLGGFTEKQSGLANILKESTYKQYSYYTPWLSEPDTLVIHYEDLTVDNEEGQSVVNSKTLGLISDWLGLARTTAELEAIAEALSPHLIHCPPHFKKGLWKDYYTPQLLPIYRKNTGNLLSKLQYETDPEWFPPRVGNRAIMICQPKAGTHLLDKTLHELGLHLMFIVSPSHIERLGLGDSSVYNIFSGLLPGEYFMSHLNYSWNAAQVLNELDFKKIVIIRDPHDVVVSFMRYLISLNDKYLRDLPDDDARLMIAIRGALQMNFLNYWETFHRIVSWRKEPNCLLIRFEDLIGRSGQGDREQQIKTIQSICQHLEIEVGPEQLGEVADSIFDRNATTFNEGQIGTWQRYFKPEHHRVFNKLWDEMFDELGYKRYFLENTVSCEFPVLAITVPGTGIYLLDLVLDELGLGRHQILQRSFPVSAPVEAPEGVPLDMIAPYQNSPQAVEEIFEGVKPNKYLIGYMPFSKNGAEIARRQGFKKIVLVGDERDSALILVKQLLDSNNRRVFPVSNYLRSLPDEKACLEAVVQGVTSQQTGDPAVTLPGIKELYNHLSLWSQEPDTLLVNYGEMAGENFGGSRNRQLATIGTICDYLGIEYTPGSIEKIADRINRRINPQNPKGHVNQ